MEIVSGIIEILFKLAVIIYMAVMRQSYKTIVEYINSLQKTYIAQVQYTDSLRNKVKKLEKELEKKGRKKNEKNTKIDE